MELKFILPPLTAEELGTVLGALSSIDDRAVKAGDLNSQWAQTYRLIDENKQVVGLPL
jgi:hypothetical protein